MYAKTSGIAVDPDCMRFVLIAAKPKVNGVLLESCRTERLNHVLLEIKEWTRVDSGLYSNWNLDLSSGLSCIKLTDLQLSTFRPG